MDRIALEEFKNIYKKVYSKDIDDLKASELSEALICLYREVYLSKESNHENGLYKKDKKE